MMSFDSDLTLRSDMKDRGTHSEADCTRAQGGTYHSAYQALRHSCARRALQHPLLSGAVRIRMIRSPQRNSPKIGRGAVVTGRMFASDGTFAYSTRERSMHHLISEAKRVDQLSCTCTYSWGARV